MSTAQVAQEQADIQRAEAKRLLNSAFRWLEMAVIQGDAIRARSNVEQEKEWQPIESAPNCDVDVLVRCASGRIAIASNTDNHRGVWTCNEGALYDVIEWYPIPK